jgi:hypothetical protein
VQVDDLPGLRIHLWRDAVSLSPRHVPLLFQVKHPAVERIRIPFIYYYRIARSIAFIYDAVAAIRTVYRYQGFHQSSSLLSLCRCVLQFTGRRSR